MNKELFKQQFEGKRVLVTGHTGFKGSWLTTWLCELGADVCGYSKYLPSQPNHFDVLGIEKKITHVIGDIRNGDLLVKMMNDFKPQVVFHMAAQSLVRASYENPKETFDVNLGGTVNMLDVLRQCNYVQAAVMITSDKCYENIGLDVGYKETDQLGGADPYSASKACAEIAFSTYFKSFFQYLDLRIATVRAGNVIGGGDWACDRIVPDCVRAWSRGSKPIIRKPEATRPWQHVLEPLSGYLWLAAELLQKGRGNGQSYNFGPNSAEVKSVGELADEFLKFWGDGGWIHEPLEGHMKEAKLLKLSIEKAYKDLAWVPTLNFTETIQLTADWYRQFYADDGNVYNLTVQQIDTYIEKACQKELAWTCA